MPPWTWGARPYRHGVVTIAACARKAQLHSLHELTDKELAESGRLTGMLVEQLHAERLRRGLSAERAENGQDGTRQRPGTGVITA